MKYNTYYNMHGLQNSMQREQTRSKRQLLYDSIYLKWQKRQIYRDSKHISGCLGLGGKWEITLNGYKLSFGDSKNVLKSDFSDGCTTVNFLIKHH